MLATENGEMTKSSNETRYKQLPTKSQFPRPSISDNALKLFLNKLKPISFNGQFKSSTPVLRFKLPLRPGDICEASYSGCLYQLLNEEN